MFLAGILEKLTIFLNIKNNHDYISPEHCMLNIPLCSQGLHQRATLTKSKYFIGMGIFSAHDGSVHDSAIQMYPLQDRASL